MTPRRPLSRLLFCAATFSAALYGCAGSQTGETPDGSGSSTGGTTGSGGAATGGTTGSGGAATGGTTGSGGAATGGTTGSGGGNPVGTGGGVPIGSGGTAAGTGGAGSGGSASGGMMSTGGAGGTSTGGGGGRSDAGGRGGGAGGKSATGGAGGSSTGVGGMSVAGKSAGCGTTPTIASGMYNNGTTIPITVGGVQRRFILSVPTNYDNTKPYKLIIAWHQLDGNDKQMYANGYYHLQNLSGNNAIFVAPNGEKSNAPCTGTGNGESGCGWPDAGGRNIALGDAVVELIEKNFCVDTSRIFATGWSYGGSMSYRTACSRPFGGTTASWGVRAVAVYSGAQLSGNCTPTIPVAYYHSHGTADNVLPYDDSKNNNPDGGGVALGKNFAKANGCTWATPAKVTSGNHICTDLMGCKTGYPVKWCSFNGPHTPDPNDPGQNMSWQYKLVWDWFNQF